MKEFSFIPLTRKDFTGDEKGLYNKIKDADIIINLAGVPIIKRWTKKNKDEIYQSRIITTRKLVHAVEMMDHSVHLISASAIGIYNDVNRNDEASRNLSEGFIKDLLVDWEAEAFNIGEPNKISVIRIGLVMSPQGGMIKRLLPLFKLGLGGTIGNGEQMMSFIHIEDLVRSIDYIIREEVEGIVNLTSPAPVSNKDFTKSFGRILRRPALLKVPKFILKLMFGKGAEIIASGKSVYPGVLINKGFIFKYPDLNSTLKNIIESS